jgi:hypothetical protein
MTIVNNLLKKNLIEIVDFSRKKLVVSTEKPTFAALLVLLFINHFIFIL